MGLNTLPAWMQDGSESHRSPFLLQAAEFENVAVENLDTCAPNTNAVRTITFPVVPKK
jgi:hypothetical protein